MGIYMSCCCHHSNSDRDRDSIRDLRDPGLDCCYADNPFIPEKRICCNGDCCGLYDSKRRDCFWPDFTHPEWLCCRVLYGCRALGNDDIFDDRIADDRGCRGGRDDREENEDADTGNRRRRGCGCGR